MRLRSRATGCPGRARLPKRARKRSGPTNARAGLPGTGRVGEARQQALGANERAGLPHRRIEDWKYTDLRVLMREVLPLAAEPDAAALARAAAAAKLHAIDGVRRLVLVDGAFAPKLSESGNLEKGLLVRGLREVL